MDLAMVAQDFSEVSTSFLREVCAERGHAFHELDFTRMRMTCAGPGRWELSHSGRRVGRLDAALPRLFGTQVMEFKLCLLDHMEGMGIPLLNGSEVFRVCRNKFRTAQFLQRHRIPTPATRLTLSPQEAMRSISRMRKPVIVKLLGGSQGRGVMKASDDAEALALLETFQVLGETTLVQDFVPNSGEDFRAFVIGTEVQMPIVRRRASKGHFRSNVHLGGKGEPVHSGRDEVRELASRCAEALGSHVLGVDVMEGPDGPVVLELNSSPGFNRRFRAEGIIDHAEGLARR